MTARDLALAYLSVMSMALGCGRAAPPDSGPALQSITGQDLARDIEILASDEYEGRKPGTRGEDLTVAYLEQRFREIGLAPGNPDGSYIQRVPLIGVTSRPTASVTVRGRKIPLRTPEDFVARSLWNQDRVTVAASELVFAGYGIEAPEYGWNDLEGVDLKGKTVLVLLGEPSRSKPDDSTTSDPDFFKGVEQSYYGTSRYKRDLTATKAASAIVFIFGIGAPIAYQASAPNYRAEALDIDAPGRAVVPVQAAMPADRLRQLLALAGHNLDSLAGRARHAGFRGIPLGLTISFDLALRPRRFESRNVVGRLQGSDQELGDQYVVFSAHWDAFGRDTSLTGDQIRNGAIDDAGGVAQILEIAAAFRALPRPPRRSVLFLATTAEEAGLLGARYYARNPLYPLERTLANINFDNFFAYGSTSDVINFGDGRSELDDVLRDVVATQKRRVVPDPFPTEGFYFRMDHFELANVGVPAISPSLGIDVIGQPAGFGKAKVEEYLQRDYHQVSDEVRPDWDYGGAVQDAQMGFLIGLRVAEDYRWPEWKPNAEFKARRDSMMAGVSRR